MADQTLLLPLGLLLLDGVGLGGGVKVGLDDGVKVGLLGALGGPVP